MFVDSIRDLLGFNARTLYEEYNSSPDPVDIISFNIIFIETDIVKGMIFKGKPSGKIMNFTTSVYYYEHNYFNQIKISKLFSVRTTLIIK